MIRLVTFITLAFIFVCLIPYKMAPHPGFTCHLPIYFGAGRLGAAVWAPPIGRRRLGAGRLGAGHLGAGRLGVESRRRTSGTEH